MSQILANWSDHLVDAATIVMALAFFAHAAEWAFARERRTRVAGRAFSDTPGADVPAPAESTPEGSSLADGAVTPERASSAGSGSAGSGSAGSGSAGSGSAGSGAVGAGGGGVAVLEAPADRRTGDSDIADIADIGGGSDGDGGAEDQRRERSALWMRIGIGLSILATALLGLGVVSRGLAAQRVPWSNLYEFATTGTFVVGTAYLVSSKRFRLGWLGLPVTGFLLLVLGVAVTVLYTPVEGLIPALQSYWLVIHVSAAVTATAVFSVGFFASILQLLRARAERRAIASGEPVRGNLARLPSAEAIDRVAYRLHAFAFPIYTFAMIAGAIWASRAWGRYWGWDPKETWMFITWVSYAAYLHARSTAGWRSKVSWVSLVAYGTLLFNLIGVNFVVSGLHSYAGV